MDSVKFSSIPEASKKSLGTVGYPVDNSIHVELETVENKPMVKIFSPNIGRHIDLDGKFIENLKKYYQTNSIQYTIQDGEDAGQTVPHCHIHVIPIPVGYVSKGTDNPNMKNRNIKHSCPL